MSSIPLLSRFSSFRPVLLGLAVLISGCGFGVSGGGGGSVGSGGGTPATFQVVEYYDQPTNAQKKAEGLAYTGTGGVIVRQGAWIEYFANPANTKQWDRTYANGIVDATQPWTEWNADGSIRDDHDDE